MSRYIFSPFVFCVLLTFISGCGGTSKTMAPLQDTTIVSSSVSSSPNPQVASYSVTLSQPGNVSVEFGTDTSYGFSTSQQHTPATGTPAVDLLVAGMKAKTTYHMRAKVELDNGTTATDKDQTFTTGDLPANVIPNFTVSTTSGLTPQPGVELVDPIVPAPYQVPFATDLQGNVLWTYNPPEARQSTELIYPVKLLSNGHLMALIAPNFSDVTKTIPPSEPDLIREFDLAGNTIRQLTMADLNAKLAAGNFNNLSLQVFNHDFTELPNGHILVIANTLKQFTNLVGYPGTSTVLGDVVVDLDTDLNPVWVWNEFDHLDVNRHPMGFPDWSHSNALAYSPDDGNFLISLRHQNWILKVDYRDGAGTGNIVWRLGQGGDFKLQGAVDPDDWFYAQHDVNFVSSNTTGSFKLAIMDNGDDRIFTSSATCGTAGAPACYTTIPIMQVDENAKTASFLFHQVLPVDHYSFFAGSTRVLPNANIEYNLAGVGRSADTIEVTPTANPQTVWEMKITNANTYRSVRLPSLYPGVQW